MGMGMAPELHPDGWRGSEKSFKLRQTTKQGTSHFLMYVNIRKLTYILSRSTVLYPLRTVVRK